MYVRIHTAFLKKRLVRMFHLRIFQWDFIICDKKPLKLMELTKKIKI